MSRSPISESVPVEANAGDMRLRILNAAAQLFTEHGFDATSLDQVGASVGLHKATLYHYVESKDQILYECLNLSFEQFSDYIDELHDTERPVFERLRNFFCRLAEVQSTTFGRCLALVGAQPLRRETGGKIRTLQRDVDQAVRTVLLEGMDSGAIRPFRPATVAAMLFGIYNGIPRWYRQDGALTLQQISNRIFDVVEHGIALTPRFDGPPPGGVARDPIMTITQPDSARQAATQYDNIIREAAILFAENDFDPTSLNSIAARVNINKATLYHYIRSKDELLYLCLDRSFQNLDEAVSYLRHRAIPPIARLRAFHDLLIHAQNNIYGRCLNLISPQALRRSASSAILEFQRRLDDAARALYADGVAAGDLREMPPIIFTATIYGASNWVPRWFDPRQEGGLQHVIDTFFDIFVNGLATATARER
jgi:AcrR family transcriptional regulator